VASGSTELTRPDVAWLVDLLWPDAAHDGPGPRYGLISANGRPRLVVPLGSRRAAARAVARISRDSTRKDRIARRLASAGLRSGVALPFLRPRFASRGGPTGLESHLATVLGHPIHLAVTVGPRRPNRKPVLHVIDGAGSTVAFVKVGWNGLTRQLVENEAGVLDAVPRQRLEHVGLPEVISHDWWGDLALLVLSPLQVAKGEKVQMRDPRPDELLDVFGLHGTQQGPLMAGAYWHDLLHRASRLGDEVGAEALEAMDRLGPVAERRTRFGAWHGDWTPWNMTPTDRRLLVWDWERFEQNKPAGLDVAHYTFQRSWLRRGRAPEDAAAQAVVAVDDILPFYRADPELAPAVTALYLVELTLRYAENARAGTDELRRERHAQVRRALRST
jgi:hypothetical protein